MEEIMSKDILGIQDVDFGTLKSAFLNHRGNILYEGVLSREEILKVITEIKKYSREKLMEKVIGLFDKVEAGEIKEENLDKVEAYLVLLLRSIPVSKEEADTYWKETAESIRNTGDNTKVIIEVAATHPLINGQPSKEFADRLKTAIQLYQTEIAKQNEVIIYIPGSKHSISKNGILVEDAKSLSSAGKEFLLQNGIPDQNIVADDANQKYKGDDGVYNSGDECYVATQLAKDMNCGRIISIVSPVQIYRKFLFYQEFGYNPEMYAVPTEKLAHNYVGETFWSLYITYMKDHNWQTDFLSYLTRKERDKNYYPGKIQEYKRYVDEILQDGANIPDEVLQQRAQWQQKYSIAAENMQAKSENSALLVDYIGIQGKSEEEIQRINSLLASNPDSNITLVVNPHQNTQDMEEYIHLHNPNGIKSIRLESVEDIAQEFQKGQYRTIYGIYPSGISMRRALAYIKNGVIPIISSLPDERDNYLENISQLLEDVTKQPRKELPENEER